MTNPFADYLEHRSAFRALYEAHCARRILLFEGSKNSGKSYLLEAGLDEAQQAGVACVLVGLDTEIAVENILKQIEFALGSAMFPRFSRESSRSYVPQASLEQIQQQGEGHSVKVEQHVHTSESPEQRSAAHTNAWFEDIQALDKPLLLLFDAYDEALHEVKLWISGSFLSRVVHTPTLRVVVSGQEIPHKTAWRHCSNLRRLEGVKNPQDWLEFITQSRRILKGEHPERQLGWLEGLCEAFQGRPGDIAAILQTLPECPE